MHDYSDIDFDAADHRQRKILRVALTEIFNERSLAMFLEDEMDFVLRHEVRDGPFKEQVFELIKVLRSRGRLGELMRMLFESRDFAGAPALQHLVLAWTPVSVGRRGPRRSREERATEPVERILDGKVSRMRPMSWISGIAAIRRRVCRLDMGDYTGTGFLVGRDVVMTAAHACARQAAGGMHHAVFDFGLAGEGIADTVRKVALGPPAVRDPPGADCRAEDYWQSLNFALLPLGEPVGDDPTEGDSPRGWFDLAQSRERLREGETLFLLHHPRGGPMSLSEGVIIQASAPEHLLAHTCPTEGGSSGAPIVDAKLQLVGVHAYKKMLESDDGRKRTNLAVRSDRVAAAVHGRGFHPATPPSR